MFGEITLTWGIPESNGGLAIDNYEIKVYKSQDDVDSDDFIMALDTDQTAIDFSVQPDQNYWVRIRSEN